ncbi:hypothetical protein JR316_0011006 [Psilocybe cubensis]|nr:hypothetical protein JR316_0011006 [Psilocybe cubensis]KAH9477090.1 hypothetical protein JR316_0011006 [Psilocybe cubensis]
MAMKQHCQLPYELFGMILQFCDTPNLKIASLVNRVFFELSLPHLFRCVLLRSSDFVPDADDTSEYLTAQTLHSIIESRPIITEYVRSLTIDISKDWLQFHVNSWVMEDTILQGLLPRLQQLKEILIYGQPTINWGDLPQQLRNSLQTAVQSPLLHTFGIGGIFGFPLRSILCSPSIKHFSHSSSMLMLDAREGGTHTPSTSRSRRPLDLQSLSLLETLTIDCHVLRAAFVLNHLVEFNFSLKKFEGMSQYALIINACAQSLEILGIQVDRLAVTPITTPLFGPDLTFEFSYDQDFPVMDLSHLPKLRKLTFSTYIEGDFHQSPAISIDATPILLSDISLPANFCFAYPWKDLVNAFFAPNLAEIKSFNLNFNTVTTRPYRENFMTALQNDALLRYTEVAP